MVQHTSAVRTVGFHFLKSHTKGLLLLFLHPSVFGSPLVELAIAFSLISLSWKSPSLCRNRWFSLLSSYLTNPDVIIYGRLVHTLTLTS